MSTVNYSLYQRRNLITPFLIVDDDTIDSTTTCMLFVGHNIVGYGQSEQQDLLWLLENQANNTAPSPAILGQNWFNTVDNNLYVCVNQGSQTFRKVSQPLVASSAPTLSLSVGDQWYNTGDSRLYAWNGSVWNVIGPISDVPVTAEAINYFTATTSDGTPTVMYINGVGGSRLVIPTNTSWLFKIDLIARVQETTSEVISMDFKGTLDRPDSGAPSILGGISNNIYVITSTLAGTVTATVTADTINNALQITVTGQTGKTIIWNAICTTVMISNS